jgi:serine protease Do
MGEIVRSTVPGQAAARSGIQQGDVILRVNGQPVNPDQTVSYLIANTTVGSRVPLDIIRDGRRQTIQAVVGQRPSEEELAKQAGAEEETAPMADEAPVAPGTALGLSLQTLTPQIGRAVGLPATARGVIITAVDPSSDAADKGLRRGDLIMSVNRQAVTSPQTLLAAVAAARRAGRSSILLLVKRGRAPEAFIGIDIGKP